MGLAMVQGIVESYGGTISVASKLGKGSIFRIFLPVTRKSSEQPQDEKVQQTLPEGNERILFVDDEPALAKMGAKILESLGYSVISTTSSIRALELFRSESEAIDLVITDMTMPNMSGEVLAKELMTIKPQVPVILITGYNKNIEHDSAMRAGIKAFCDKPIGKEGLALTVRKVLDESIL